MYIFYEYAKFRTTHKHPVLKIILYDDENTMTMMKQINLYAFIQHRDRGSNTHNDDDTSGRNALKCNTNTAF